MGKEWEWESGCEGVQGAQNLDQIPTSQRPDLNTNITSLGYPFVFLDHGALSFNL